MEKEVRARIQRATQEGRQLLEREFTEQLEGVYDIQMNGTVASAAGFHLAEDAPAQRARIKLVAAVAHHRAQGLSAADAVAALRRECAFTTFNRFVALKMLEAREIVLECVSRGTESKGFKEFLGLAPGLAGSPESAWRLYLECVFDEIGREVRVLFDRRDPASLLWPRRAALDALLAILNDAELGSVWGEDETIGWVYQYFNSDADRHDARYDAQGKPKPPANGREMAIRNQFFTPRYVVEALTENTLGQLWVEMRGGETQIFQICTYLVRRPNTIHLSVDEATILGGAHPEKPAIVYPFRAKKDPRDIKVLDPASGSGHFLLYAFDLLLCIYREAWADSCSPPSGATGGNLHADYPTVDALHLALPGLILRHNLHGIDIDPRAAQIAALALWMRAQSAWIGLGVNRADRPLVTRSNVVVAEPMPGERDLLNEFCRDLDADVAALLHRVFDEMEFAGEAGTLLRVEETVRRELENRFTRGGLYAKQDQQRWVQVEKAVYDALHEYATAVPGGGGYGRKLFADDAAQGFAFIDSCRARYDVVLMNPPFGEQGANAKAALQSYQYAGANLICAFIERACELVGASGLVGAVVDRTVLIKNSFESFRRDYLFGRLPICAALDLGWQVLDANVEVSAIVAGGRSGVAFGGSVTTEVDKASAIGRICLSAAIVRVQGLMEAPFSAINFELPAYLIRALSRWRTIGQESTGFVNGHTIKSDELKRLVWELAPAGCNREWAWMWNGSEYSPFYVSMREVVIVGEQSRRIDAHPTTIYRSPHLHKLPGLCFGKRGDYLDVQPLPAGFVLTNEGFGGPMEDCTWTWFLLAYLQSAPVQHALNSYCGQHKGVGYVNALPVPPAEVITPEVSAIAAASYAIWHRLAAEGQGDETDPRFRHPWAPRGPGRASAAADLLMEATAAVARLVTDAESGVARLLCTPEEADSVLAANPNRPPPVEVRGGRSSTYEVAADIVSWLVGCSFGRFDVRAAAGVNTAWASPDPFRPLPPYPPGSLTDEEGRPARLPPEGYPIAFPPDGILVDDAGHDRDLLGSIGRACGLVFGENADEHLREVAAILDPGSSGLRSWLRRAFFAEHIQRYSKSRRKAPIYWCLGSASTDYGVWVYVHRFAKDTLHRVVTDHVVPKLRYEEARHARLLAEAGSSPSPSQRKELAEKEAHVVATRTLFDEVSRVAPLWDPHLDDGVLINAAPLHRLFSHTRAWQEECEAAWAALLAGESDWSHLAMRLWPERVLPKCVADRSLAIAHGLEQTLWVEIDGTWSPRSTPTDVVTRLVNERASPAVKAAVASLERAGAMGPTTRAPREKRVAAAKRGPRSAAPRQLPVPTPTVAPDGPVLDTLRAAFHEFPDPASRADLLAVSGLDEASWKSAIDALVTRGEVERTGQARGTRYTLVIRPAPSTESR